MRIGDGARGGGGPVVPTGVGDSRVTIDYSDDDTADNGAGEASTETVMLPRSNAGISNLNPDGGVADVVWEISTDRTNWNSAKVTLKFLESEVAALNGDDNDLVVFSAPAPDGPWTQQATTVDAARNELSATVTGFSFFAIGSTNPVPVELSGFEIE